jgi:hypothetical protein
MIHIKKGHSLHRKQTLQQMSSFETSDGYKTTTKQSSKQVYHDKAIIYKENKAVNEMQCSIVHMRLR